ncbi:hypothetical protein M9M90_02375 [Phenylobacterium sp. LH3H17]|uniref:hypothetical protein n=1 Tax=Phenylobacterium sp. LH3H17 TaxID=2903901 RepID=UPI0020CA153E|nr:hypothetical protein [Phenylobacterium sp. LH3H17]UTP40039.1 hypothetical protein M9M90_02375 [Phenylobacterium sp. LH3H17]
MKKILLSLTAAAALTAAAVPAAAQSYDGHRTYERTYERGYDGGDRYDRGNRYDGGDRYDRGNRYERNDRADRLQWRIERAERRGDLSYQEAARLRGYVQAVENLADRYRRNGYTTAERRAIEQRYASIEHRLRQERNEYGYGYGERR